MSIKNLWSLLAAAFVCLNAASVAFAAEEGWEELFNGKDLTGWKVMNDAKFEVVDGNLRLVKGMGWLCSDQEFTDFVLEAEWRALVPQYDSGIYVRAGLTGKPWPDDGWQVNMRYDALGGLVKGFAPKEPSATPKLPVNKWVKFRIEVRGNEVTLDVDGERAWEYKGVDAVKGRIGIQAEEKAFDFRNIRIKPLAPQAPAK